MQTDCESQAQAFLDRFGIKFRATLSDSKVAPWHDRPAKCECDNTHEQQGTCCRFCWDAGFRTAARGFGHHYRVCLWHTKARYVSEGRPKNYGRRLTLDFWSSIADAEKGIKTVTPYGVLACISSDIHGPETFEDFCAEFGYEQDSIKALQTFRRCSAFAKRLQAFFTKEEMEALSEIQ